MIDLVSQVREMFQARHVGPGMYCPGPPLSTGHSETSYESVLERLGSSLVLPCFFQYREKSLVIDPELQEFAEMVDCQPCAIVRMMRPCDWFSSEGSKNKRKLIEARGIPNMSNWRFITLTLDHAKVGYCPLQAYHEARHKLTLFFRSLNRRFGHLRYCCKVEFQRNGFVHFHICYEYGKFSLSDLKFLRQAWGLGAVNVKRMNAKGWAYVVKYATKPTEANQSLDWFFDHIGNDGKTFMRARLWIVSKGFYLSELPRAGDKKAPGYCLFYVTVRQALERASRKITCSVQKNTCSLSISDLLSFKQLVLFYRQLDHLKVRGGGTRIPIAIINNYLFLTDHYKIIEQYKHHYYEDPENQQRRESRLAISF